jgi:hypothetical protein
MKNDTQPRSGECRQNEVQPEKIKMKNEEFS